MIKDFLKYFFIGIFTAYLVIYGLRPSIPYPEYILYLFEHKWIFIIIFLINYYIFLIDLKLAILMLLSILALLFDYIVFAKKGYKKQIIKKKEIDMNKIKFIS